MRQFATNYLYCRGRIFYLRRVIALPGRQGFVDLRISLKTSEPTVAKSRCASLNAYLDSDLQISAGNGMITAKDIQYAAQEKLAELISKAKETILLSDQNSMFDLDQEISQTQTALVNLRKKLTRREFSVGTVHEAKEVLASLGEKGTISINSDECQLLCEALMKAWIEANRYYLGRLTCDPEMETPVDPLFAEMDIAGIGLPPLPSDDASTSKKMTFDEAAIEFLKPRRKGLGKKTVGDYERVFRYFSLLGYGSKNIKAITKDDYRAFQSALARIPVNAEQVMKKEGKTLSQLISEERASVLHGKTANKYFDMLKAFENEALDKDWIDRSVMPKGKAVQHFEDSNRRSFSPDELRLIFEGPLFRGCQSTRFRYKPGNLIERDGVFWSFLIALFEGMRTSEIVTLTVSDIRRSNLGVAYIAVNKDQPFKKLKTPQSKREMPIHPTLQKIGFIEWAEKQGEANDRLFPDLKIYEKLKDPAHDFSKTANRIINNLGLTSPDVAFYSLRHTFRDALSAANVEDSRIIALMGHKNFSQTFKYGTGAGANLLVSDLAKVHYDIDFSHLYVDHAAHHVPQNRVSVAL